MAHKPILRWTMVTDAWWEKGAYHITYGDSPIGLRFKVYLGRECFASASSLNDAKKIADRDAREREDRGSKS